MSNLKDTDIDDLFRRASDKYPLRTDSSDWDRMAAALEKDPPPNEPTDPDNTDRRRRRFVWLFLLLPLGGLGYYTWHQSGHSHNPAVTRVRTGDPHAGTETPAGTESTAAKTTTATTARSTVAKPTVSATTTPTASNPSTTSPTSNTSATSTTPATTHYPTSTIHTTAGTIHAGTTRGDIAHGATHGDVTNNGTAHNNRIPTHGRTRTTGTTVTTSSNQPGDRFGATGSTPVADAFTLRASDINEQRASIAGNYKLTVDVKAPLIQKDTSAPKKKASANTKSSYLYAGILGAPDLSTVKMQSVKGVGTTFSFLLGYAINNRWAIETGVSIDRKRYYTDGEYFNTKNVRLPNYSYLENVDGTCYMWEIPLNVRYNFNPDGKTKWFATAGFSTYLMTKEKYNYKYGWNNWPGSADSSWNIKKPSQYPFSVINLSAGFEQRLGKVGNLRIEPYVRLPLGNIGTGKLPIMSAGVNIGITRRLW